MGAAGRAPGARCDEASAGQGDGWQVTIVVAQDGGERIDGVGEFDIAADRAQHRLLAVLFQRGGKHGVEPGLGPAGTGGYPFDQRRATVHVSQDFQRVGQRDLALALGYPRPFRRPDHAEDDVLGGTHLEFEQALVDVADLLDIQGTEAQPTALSTSLDVLDGAKHPQHGAVVDSGYPAAGINCGATAAFQPGEAIGVEHAAAVGGHAQILVGDALVDGAGDGEQAVPGTSAVFQGLLAQQAGLGTELVDESADAVGGDVDGVVAGQ